GWTAGRTGTGPGARSDPARAQTRRALRPGARSDPAQDGDDAAHDGGVVAGDRLERRVLRQQPGVPVTVAVGLDGRLAVEHRRDDLPVVRRRLLADDHPVAVA